LSRSRALLVALIGLTGGQRRGGTDPDQAHRRHGYRDDPDQPKSAIAVVGMHGSHRGQYPGEYVKRQSRMD
jgi:hypothetical protein